MLCCAGQFLTRRYQQASYSKFTCARSQSSGDHNGSNVGCAGEVQGKGEAKKKSCGISTPGV